MTRSLRSPSLFLTFAGAFLLVLILAAVLQGFVLFAIFRPLAERWARERAEPLVRQVALEIAGRDEPSREEIREILQSHPTGPERPFLVYLPSEGRVVSGRPLPPGMSRRLTERVRDGSEAGDPFPRDRPGPGGGRQGGPPPGAISPRNLDVLARAPVVFPSGAGGEVVALSPPRRFGILPAATPRPLLLFLPLAVLIAGVAGLVMFRVLLRRIRGLEDLATRVTDGDLSARVEDPGPDEIGRLGAKLNFMTQHLAEARDRLEQADRQRRRFLADVSHELATPLTSIRGYAETLLNPDVSTSVEERSEYLGSIRDESKRMDGLIQDLLDLARLEAGVVPLDRERLDWAALCRNAASRYEKRFGGDPLRMTWEGPSEGLWVDADGRRMEQVIENLLLNALRYVPEGGTVTLRMESGDTSHRLIVSDDGPGVPGDQLPHIFERFYRADPSRTIPGTGLGLALVREIVTRHGGSVAAEPGEPRGLTVVVEIPASPGEDPPRGL